MKLQRRIGAWMVLAGVTLANSTAAQTEQWLRYHTSRDYRGYAWLELTTNPPPNVALPKLNAGPYFARWTTPLDATGGRWLCFDRTRKSGPHDRVFCDRNGNGRLDDDAPEKAARVDTYSANFDPLRFVFKGEDGPITYHLGFRFMKYDDQQVRALAESACDYQGTVNIGGKKQRLRLIDGNVNGVFDDLAAKPYEGDRLEVGEEKDDERMTRFLGRLLELDGQFFAIEVARDGAFVKIKNAENLVFGQVRVPNTISEFTAVGENGHFIRHVTNGQFTLPVGNYCIHRWNVDRKDDKGVAWQLSGYSYSDAAEFQAASAEPVRLEIGEPVRAAFQASEAKGTVSFSLRLQGQWGESIEILRGKERPRAPQLALTSRDGSFAYTNTFEYG